MFVQSIDRDRVDWARTADLLVIGGGGCGLSAAVAASAYDCDVILLEKANRTGGKARIATGQICGVDSKLQQKAGIEDSAEKFYKDLATHQTEESNERYDLNQMLIETVARESGPTIDWLVEEIGVDLTLHTGRFSMTGHSVYRTHYPVLEDGVIPRAGEPVTDALHETAIERGVDIHTNCPMDQILLDEETGDIIGVISKRNPEPIPRKQENVAFQAEHILLACDGFAANPELVEELIPEVTDLDYWGTQENTGEAIRIARELGLQLEEPLYDMHGPFTVPDGVYLPNELVKAGAIMVNESGKRFMDCGNVPYRMMDKHILNQENATAYLVIDRSIVDDFLSMELTRHQFGYVMDDDTFNEFESLSEFAIEYELDANAVAKTVETVNHAVEGQNVPFGRKYVHELTAPLYAAKIQPMYVKARQGIAVDKQLRVLRKDGSPVENLYAGGNASESLEGGDPNVYQPGMDLMTALTEGRIVGERVGELYGGE